MLCCSLQNGCHFTFQQRIDAFVPPGDFIGCIEQEWTLLIPRFVIRDEYRRTLYYMEGPRVCTCAMYKDATFQVQ